MHEQDYDRLVKNPKAKWKKTKKAETDTGAQTDTSSKSVRSVKSKQNSQRASSTSRARKSTSKATIDSDADEDTAMSSHRTDDDDRLDSRTISDSSTRPHDHYNQMTIIMRDLQEVRAGAEGKARVPAQLREDLLRELVREMEDAEVGAGDWAKAHLAATQVLRPYARNLVVAEYRRKSVQ